MFKFAFIYLFKNDDKNWNDFSIFFELLKKILKNLNCNYINFSIKENQSKKIVRKNLDMTYDIY